MSYQRFSETAVGIILPFAQDLAKIPDNFLVCDGSQYNKNDYPDLFNVIGYNFGGSGDNFKVPDLRGLFLRGWNNSRSACHDPEASSRSSLNGGCSGDKVGSYQGYALKEHHHHLAVSPHHWVQYDDYQDYMLSLHGGNSGTCTAWTCNSCCLASNSIEADDTRPKNLNFHFIIKY